MNGINISVYNYLKSQCTVDGKPSGKISPKNILRNTLSKGLLIGAVCCLAGYPKALFERFTMQSPLTTMALRIASAACCSIIAYLLHPKINSIASSTYAQQLNPSPLRNNIPPINPEHQIPIADTPANLSIVASDPTSVSQVADKKFTSLVIKTISGQNLHIENIDLNQDCTQIKKIILEKEGLPIKNQRLVCGGKQLIDHVPLIEFQSFLESSNYTIHIVLKLIN